MILTDGGNTVILPQQSLNKIRHVIDQIKARYNSYLMVSISMEIALISGHARLSKIVTAG